MPHAHKAVTVAGIVKALTTLGLRDEVFEGVRPETRAVLENPQRARLHPGAIVNDAFTVLAEKHGMQSVEEVMARATADSLEGIIGPLARLFMTIKGSGPAALLQRFETLLSGGTHGFTSRWEPRGETAGVLVVATDDALPPISEYAMKGAVQHLLVFAQVKGSVGVVPRALNSTELRLDVEWTTS